MGRRPQRASADLDVRRGFAYPSPPMNRTSLTAALLWLAASPVAFAAEPLSLAPREGVVLLANGELIAGTIIPAGDRYDVHLKTGEIRIRRSDVAMICADARECYLKRRAAVEPGRVGEHLALAEWCIRNDLLAEADQELAAARSADPMHPRIRLVESRLTLARQPPPSAPASTPERLVSHDSLDDMARNLPHGAMETFTNNIQPLLLNYCSKSGCHAGRTDGALKLERIHPTRSGRSATQRNLQRVLALVNRDDPSASKLLQAPIRAHGPLGAPIFTDRQQTQYRQLVQWVYVVAGARLPAERPTLEERTAPLLQAVPGAVGAPPTDVLEADESLDSGQVETLESPPPQSESRIPASSADQAYTLEQLCAMGVDPYSGAPGRVLRPTVQRGATPAPEFVPKDEFDPEIFNRRFFGR